MKKNYKNITIINSNKKIDASALGAKKVEVVKQSIQVPKVTNNKFPYYIKINRLQNFVMVYGLNNGEYSKLVKTFVWSTGTATQNGTFKTVLGVL